MIKQTKDILTLAGLEGKLYTSITGKLHEVDAICVMFENNLQEPVFIAFDGTIKDCVEKVKQAISDNPEIADYYIGCSIVEDDIVRPINFNYENNNIFYRPFAN